MEESQISIAQISKHIESYITPEVKQKGERLYGQGTVEFKVLNKSTDTFKFHVQGKSTYKVNIQGASTGYLENSCTCTNSWGGFCEHVVASLLYIIDYADPRKNTRSSAASINFGSDEEEFQVLRKIDEPYEIENYQAITEQSIIDNTSVKIYNQVYFNLNDITINNIQIKTNQVVFFLQNKDKEDEIVLSYDGDKAWVTSTEVSDTNQLKPSEVFCLLLIANSPTSDMLVTIFSDQLLAREGKLLSMYGLPAETEISQYFKFDINEDNGLYIVRTKAAEGLIPVVDEEIDPAIKFINSANTEEFDLGNIVRDKERREVGFVLRLVDHTAGSSIQTLDYEIVPIIGKVSKSGEQLATHIESLTLENAYHVNKSKNTIELLSLIDQIKSEKEEAICFLFKKQAFQLLKNEPFTFGMAPNTYNIRKTNLVHIVLSPKAINLNFDILQKDDFLCADMCILLGDEPISISEIDFEQSGKGIYSIDEVLYFANNYKVYQYMQQYPGSLKMVQEYKDEFFEKVIRPISTNFNLSFAENTYEHKMVELDFNKKQVYLTEHNEYIVISPQVVYDNGIAVMLNSLGNVLVRDEDVITEYKRNEELEDDFIDLIIDFHPEFKAQRSKKIFYLHVGEFAKDLWFYKFFDLLKANSIEVYGLKDLKNFKYSPYKGKISTSVSSGQDWFEVDISVTFGDKKVSLKDIRKAVINKQRYIKLEDGSVGILPQEWFSKLEKYFRNGEVVDDKLAISKLKFSIVDELFDHISDTKMLQEIADKRRRIKTFTEIKDTEVPKEVTADLRHYQKEGLNWLNFLDEMQWGGILADDMGLGKTVQILTFLQHLINKQKSTNLIVVPTTLLFNWENEIQKFAPQLTAHYHHGTDRMRNTDEFANFDIIFTTYGILLRDIEMLSQFKFNYVILDESQAIKNPASRRYKAANLINANNRIALSGTPIENGTFDLYAQMNFANRGFFSGAGSFKENYSNAIDKEGDELRARELQKMINPFILRRTKEKVATELPDKTEDVIYCEMEKEQRAVYDAYRNDYKNRLITNIEKEGMGKSKMMVLEALTRLRQICDSPALIDNHVLTEGQSIKIKEIIRHITNKTSNHKILIFSQFVKMLTIVKEELNKLNVKYEYLDGSSSPKQRQASVNNFQENDELRVFLISLKAGGTGLNLTAADYVYILDPWWNPAVENQAIDRCYRIGQQKKVFAYRMICKDTVEEKILTLQNRKKKIAGDIIQTDEHIMKTLSTDDINDLFG